MFKRVMVAVVGLPALILLLSVAPEEATMLLVAAMCAIGAWELMHAVTGEHGKSLTPLAVLMAVLAPLDIYVTPHFFTASAELLDRLGDSLLNSYAVMGGTYVGGAQSSALPLLALLFLLALFACAIRRYGKANALRFADLTAALFAGIGFPLMLSCLLRLRLMAGGELLVWMPLCISFGSDTFALFGGMLCGKHKLTPVSPKKTVEGAVGGLIGGVVGMTLLKLIADSMILSLDVYPPIEMAAGQQISWAAVFVLGIIGSVISQIGDLSFSVIKREFGVKDYGKLLPGHGGILDRFDSVTFVAPVVWLVLQFL